MWEVEFFEESSGDKPVQKWLDSLPDNVQQKMDARIDLLEEHGPTLDHPHTSQIEGKLREIRLSLGKTRYRVLYFFDENRVGVLLHGFTKDTAAVEEADKKVGRSRMAKHNERLAHQAAKAKKKK